MPINTAAIVKRKKRRLTGSIPSAYASLAKSGMVPKAIEEIITSAVPAVVDIKTFLRPEYHVPEWIRSLPEKIV
jgi:hypothetical protein